MYTQIYILAYYYSQYEQVIKKISLVIMRPYWNHIWFRDNLLLVGNISHVIKFFVWFFCKKEISSIEYCSFGQREFLLYFILCHYFAIFSFKRAAKHDGQNLAQVAELG